MPEIRNPNIEPQGSGGGTGGGDFRSLILFTFVALAGLMVYQYFKKPDANPPICAKLSTPGMIMPSTAM